MIYSVPQERAADATRLKKVEATLKLLRGLGQRSNKQLSGLGPRRPCLPNKIYANKLLCNNNPFVRLPT